MTDRRIFKYKYAVHDVNDLTDPEDRIDLISYYDADNPWSDEYKRWDRMMIARDAGKDFHINHDGWEHGHPIIVSIFRTDGVAVGVFSVEREFEPTFSAKAVNA